MRAIRAGSLLSSNANSGQKDCMVSDSSDFTKNQIVIIADDNHLETNVIASISGSTLTMENNLVDDYTTADNGYVDPAAAQIEPELKVKDGNDAEQNITSRLRSFTLYYDFESGCLSLDATLTNNRENIDAGEGLDPQDTESNYYTNSEPLLGSYHEVTLRVKKEGGSFFTVFEGFAGPSTRDSVETVPYAGEITVTFSGVSQPLKDWAIEERLAKEYTNASIDSGASPDLLNRMITDQGMGWEIKYEDNPSYTVTKYIVSNVMLFEALENALAPTGYRLVERWHSGSSAFKMVVKDPLRSTTTPKGIFNKTFSSRRLSGHESDVRTHIVVAYRSRTTGRANFVEAKSTDAIKNKFGIPDGAGSRIHKKMVYAVNDKSLVDSESEARDLATAMLHDLEKPSPDFEISIPWLNFSIEPFDYHRFIGDTYTTDVGIMNIDWTWSSDNMIGQTVLTGIVDRVIGTKRIWLEGDIKRSGVSIQKRLKEMSSEVPPTPSRPSAVGSWYTDDAGTPKPVVDVTFASNTPWWVSSRTVKITEFSEIDSGTASGGTTDYLEDISKSWEVNQFQTGEHYIVITAGANNGKESLISSNTSNRIYPQDDFDVAIDSNSVYYVLRKKRDSKESGIDLRNFQRISDYKEKAFIGIQEAWVPSGRKSG